MSSFVKKCCVVTPCNLFYVFWGKGLQFFLFCDVFRRITTQKQLFFADLRDCVALGMEVFCVHATFLDFGDNLRCMKQVASSLVRQGISQSVASQAAPCNLAGRACSVTGCRVILHKPCNLAGKARSVTGCRPIKRQSPTASYVSELPTKQREFVFCMACSFRENLAC